MSKEIAVQVSKIIAGYNPSSPRPTADSLREFWLQFEPKSTGFVKAEQMAKWAHRWLC